MNREYLAIDYGRRRIGVAKSDPLGMVASPLTTLTVRSRADAVEQMRKLLDEYSPNGLVVGYPRHASGEPGEIAHEVDRFLRELQYAGDVFRVDESYSSQEATAIVHAHGKRVGVDKGRVDRLAAVILLQRFLDDLPSDA